MASFIYCSYTLKGLPGFKLFNFKNEITSSSVITVDLYTPTISDVTTCTFLGESQFLIPMSTSYYTCTAYVSISTFFLFSSYSIEIYKI